MFRRYVIIINALLIAGSLFLLSKIFRVWGTDECPNPVFLKKENVTNYSALKVNFAPRNPRNAYQVIINKDLFRPERTAPEQEGENTTARVPPQIVLYGIVITNASKYAWIQDQGKANKIIKISEGAEISGWKVVSIAPDTLSVKSGEQILTFNLIQPGKPKTRIIPRPNIQAQPKKPANPSASAESGPVTTTVPQPAPISSPPPLPKKK